MRTWTRRQVPLREKFWAKVRTGKDCWEWTGGTNGTYGNIGIGVRSKRRNVYAHRLSYQMHVGPIPKGAMVLHACDNPLCVRPDHLHLGDHATNTAEAVERGRFRSGADHGLAVLSNHDARWIRKAGASGFERKWLAERFGVHLRTIYRLLARETYRHPAEV